MTNTTDVGQYRHAHRVRKGWQIRFLPNVAGRDEVWLTVTDVLRVYSPLNFVRITFNDGSSESVAHDTEVFCRTAAEVRKAGE